MALLIVIIATVAIFWLSSREKPLYSKTYFQTRSFGVFKTDFEKGFREYVTALDNDVRMRFTVGPFGPTDDLYADLYHPELAANWRQDLRRSRFEEWLRDAVYVTIVVCVWIAVSDFAVRLLTGRRGLLVAFDLGASLDQIAAWTFAGGLCTYLVRNRTAINRTQGYLDGFSDRCAGLDRAMRIIAPPSPRPDGSRESRP